jgi:conjugal transfer pilin signal peptidase TrbI
LKLPKPNARFFRYLVLLCISLLVGMAIPGHLTITKTRSVKHHLFWEIDRKTLQKGDYVRLPLYEPKAGCSPCSIVKRVGCLPGDRLVNEGTKYYCNGKHLGQCKTGKNIKPFEFSGTVPPGMVFLIGDRDNSYDSRYFGFKPLSDIETVLHPIF